MFIKIGNDGPKIAETNYYDTEGAARGLFYLSWNAGAARLLVPDNQLKCLPDMLSSKMVIVSAGKLDGKPCLELLFEDYSDSPFCITLEQEMTDRALPESDIGKEFEFMVYNRDGCVCVLPGNYRVVRELPCMKAWK